MIKGIERNQLRMSKTKKQMSQLKQKELQDQDKIKLQIFDEAISRIKIMPAEEATTERSFYVVPRTGNIREKPKKIQHQQIQRSGTNHRTS
ncbi:MAG: hypothetical protein EZS28_008074 [Streblomastix strix]|uniref:Uncharacterized protein n=1 Tax=Streblomastix strix TaxID=222440 RepID=A0A5J4WPT0_9EUKA|nr:MAG: hypothetical protein EZS28_008074 [Streblomastix strix]